MATRPYHRSAFYAQTPAVIPPDSPVAQVLRERRDALLADLGGEDQCTTAQLALVDLIVASWAQLDSVTAYLLTLPSLVDKRHRRVWQVVRDRAALASQLQSLLRDVGLERRARDVPRDILAALADAATDPVTPGRSRKIRAARLPVEGAPCLPAPDADAPAVGLAQRDHVDRAACRRRTRPGRTRP